MPPAGRIRHFEALPHSLISRTGSFVGVNVKANGRADARAARRTGCWCSSGCIRNLGRSPNGAWRWRRRRCSSIRRSFETSLPGVFAVGDINFYPGKKKLILSGFHEAALAAFGIQHHLFPEKKQFLQYTTTSPIMQKRLGVTSS